MNSYSPARLQDELLVIEAGRELAKSLCRARRSYYSTPSTSSWSWMKTPEADVLQASKPLQPRGLEGPALKESILGVVAPFCSEMYQNQAVANTRKVVLAVQMNIDSVKCS
jgi:hypothetical protein